MALPLILGILYLLERVISVEAIGGSSLAPAAMENNDHLDLDNSSIAAWEHRHRVDMNN